MSEKNEKLICRWNGIASFDLHLLISIALLVMLVLSVFVAWYYSLLLPLCVLFLSIVVFLFISAGRKCLDILFGQWIYRLCGLNFQTAFFRTVWIYTIIGAITLIYFDLDLKSSKSGKSYLYSDVFESVCNAKEKNIVFVFDNCLRKENLGSLFLYLIGGFIALLAAFQAEFASKYRLLHELRKEANESLETLHYNEGLKTLYYIEHCFLFELWSNNSFEADIKRVILILSNQGNSEYHTFKAGFKRLTIELILAKKNRIKNKIPSENASLCTRFALATQIKILNEEAFEKEDDATT